MLLLALLIAQIPGFESNPAGRIVGGTEAAPGQFPYMAALNIETMDAFYLCGGSLISNEYVLTAAHCINGAIGITVRLGSNSINETDENSLIITTTEYVIHPDFDASTLENDIGVIDLQTLIIFTDYILPIYLPYQEIDGSEYVYTMGWGQLHNSDTNYPDKLQFINATTVIQDICVDMFGEGVIKETMVCVQGDNSGGSCTGDSGGPLVAYHSTSSTEWLVGIAIFVSQNGCESSDPSGFTRTFPYREWIKNITDV